jgi:trehalose 6-phosphate phosphatase
MERMLDNLSLLQNIITRRPFGLITDIDGTISPASKDPLHVIIPKINRDYLLRLSDCVELVAIVSGRSSSEVRKMIDGDKIVCIGHYGMERWQNGKPVLHPSAQPYVPAIRAVAQQIRQLRDVEGVIIQDKGATLSIHYRLSPHPLETKQQILSFLNCSPEIKHLRIIEENMVIGIVPPVPIDKGTAVGELIVEKHLRGAIYLGDDTADALGFEAVHTAQNKLDFKGFGITVVYTQTPAEVISAADFVLKGVEETVPFLKWIVQLLC